MIEKGFRNSKPTEVDSELVPKMRKTMSAMVQFLHLPLRNLLVWWGLGACENDNFPVT